MVENNRMNYFKSHQKELRIECYQGLLDHVKCSASNVSSNFEKKERLGNLFILPSTYIGSPRYMQQYYQDAMAIMRNTGKPDLFITMTCNPKWKELKEVLKNFPEGTTPNDIPNITVRLFYAKFKMLMYDIEHNNIFGTVLSYVYSIEFQKRGLPHAHIIVTLHPDDKLFSPEAIDKYISAEIPSDNLKLQKLVIKHMLHGPHTEKSPCLNKNKNVCKKNFPKQFQDQTLFKKNKYPEYKRRNNILDNYTYHFKRSNKVVPVDNSMVVPYNRFLLMKYNCHINIEYCASVQSIKYIFDYIHKGGDRACCKIKKMTENEDEENEVYDEINHYIDGRYLSPMEAAWRLQQFPLCGRSHTVTRLAVHTENQQRLVFDENNVENALSNWKTTLTAWFDLNQKDDFAKKIKYVNIPQYYNFKNKCWIKRQKIRKYKAIGRLNVVSPKDSERFFLKLILNRVKGATSFIDLRTYENQIYNTYRETAIVMGLIEHETQLYNIFEEACQIMLPVQLRKFFATFLLCENIEGYIIWEKYKNFFTEDFTENKEDKALAHINQILSTEEMSCTNFGLPEPNENNVEKVDEYDFKFITSCKQEYESMYMKLNNDQKIIFNKIIYDNNIKIHFIDGPGGSGKTFLYKTLIYYFI